MSVVVDASIIIAVIVADERQEAVRAQLDSWLTVGEGLHAPTVLPYEIANVLARLVFDGALDISAVDAIWEDLDALGLILHPFAPTQDGPDVAAITARLHRRHATDSTYVHLARRLVTTMWTLDGALARNAADVGLPVRLVS
ncbi:MAG: type II toxin-antitoxin system VapC family toxin [Acidothermales bacterium]|jgi:predicted nucleic acid-binding protein|nr:type II toxin-antitoxin system VapC family toxin [Acidothermales bacterium]